MTSFKSPNYTQTPNTLFDELLPLMGYAELKVVLVLIRRTFGYHKNTTHLSIRELAKLSKLTPRNAFEGADSAIARGIVKKETNGGITLWSVVVGDTDTTWSVVVGDTDTTLSGDTASIRERKKKAAQNAALPESQLDGYFPRDEKVIVNPTTSPKSKEEHARRIIAATTGGAQAQRSLTEIIRKLTGREVPENNTARKQITFLREQGATIESIMNCMDYCQKVLNTGKDGKVWREHWLPDLNDIYTHYRASQDAPAEKESDPYRGKKVYA